MPNNTTITPTQEIADKIKHLCSFGLTKGLGNPKPGEMCIEAVVSYAYGLPHGDDPTCVGEEVKKAKIALNDCNWSSNKARADGMVKLGIAQLGSDSLNQEEFRLKLKLASTKRIIPFLIQKHYESNKDEKLLEWKLKFEQLKELDDKLWKEFYYYNYYYYYYYYNNYYYYYYYYNNYYYYYNNYYHFGDEFLLLIADVILSVLIDMKSPGCEFL